ncbi:polysaccharide biosynthesis/export family protein [Algibacter mikhailovii]|uniref:Sugar transporter n=1 Tax=Algibacter mikhailovii TaxID=425498 RepID=A0A918R402_9FLAO|nr:polysaccharide biosynthesis/export family protein [Algibacter mikhailovii]GGZ81111.1 sugar transporter [Algibacter mikhailovii]
MKRSFLVLIVLLHVILFSCIPTKKLTYIQPPEEVVDSLMVIQEQQAPYRIQVHDILNIRVKALDQESVQIFNPVGEENLNANGEERAYFDGFSVDVHGNIRIPILGYVNVLGYTTEELEKVLEKKLLTEQFKETANIFVSVKLTGLRYTVNGEVESPGSQTIYENRLNIFEALANAGDITMVGNREDVLIIRQYPEGQKVHHLNLLEDQVMYSPYYYIQPNDIIYVKPLKQKSWGTGSTGRETLLTIVSTLTLLTTTLLLIDRL